MKFQEWIDSKKEAFEAFWTGEPVRRCLISVTAPRKGGSFRPFPAGTRRQQWLDADYRVERFLAETERTVYGGEALPVYFNNLGPGVLAAFVGGGYELGDSTVWFETDPPFLPEYPQKIRFRVNRNHELYRAMEETRKRCREEGIFVGTTDIGGTVDIAASLRGTENLLIDTIAEPENLEKLLEEIDRNWTETAAESFRTDALCQDGYASWLALWSSVPYYPLQCDLSVNLSNEMFERFVMPSLKRQAKVLDRVVYHLDGPGEIRHLDSLLRWEELDAIECVPLPDPDGWLGTNDPMWMDVYRNIQEAGKGLILRYVRPDRIRELLSILSPRKLFLSTALQNESDIDDLLAAAETWSKPE